MSTDSSERASPCNKGSAVLSSKVFYNFINSGRINVYCVVSGSSPCFSGGESNVNLCDPLPRHGRVSGGSLWNNTPTPIRSRGSSGSCLKQSGDGSRDSWILYVGRGDGVNGDRDSFGGGSKGCAGGSGSLSRSQE